MFNRLCRPTMFGIAASRHLCGTAPMNRPRVLLLDTDADQHEILGDFFRHFGYDVDHGVSVEEALRRAATYVPDLIITEWHLRGAPDGMGVRKILVTELLGSVPLIVCTSDAFAERRHGDTMPEVRQWLVKPCAPTALLPVVRTLVQG